MRVYHFLNEKYGLESIKKRHLKVSRMTDLNDPFDFYAVRLADSNLRKALHQAIQKQSEESGLLCFSRGWSSPLLWGHYAERHQGLCLGFDVPDHRLIPITYVDDRITVDIDKLSNPNYLKNSMEKDFHGWIHSKYIDWAYEDEFRAFINLDESCPDTGLYFTNYSSELRLNEVIVGCKSKVTKQQIEEALEPEFANVSKVKARAAFKTFEIVKNKGKYSW